MLFDVVLFGFIIWQALHDGHDIYFMLQVDGDYVYSKGYDLIWKKFLSFFS